MQAVRFAGVGRPAQIEDVRKPSPGPGQVLIKIGGAGVCHSDLHVMEEELGFKPPFTLGHENAGWVAALGQGVVGFKEGDAVAVYVRGAAAAVMPVSSRWRTTARTGPE
jgi:alcohol dehydrogenase, propanol-preferring